jgi:hypothetical protein
MHQQTGLARPMSDYSVVAWYTLKVVVILACVYFALIAVSLLL